MSKLIILLAIFLPAILLSQNVAINNDGSEPHQSALLDISSTTKGILIPRMTTLERITISPPVIGLTVFDVDTYTYWVYRGDINGGWREMLMDFDKRWQLNGSHIYNLNNGNVGIGLSSPTRKLHLSGTGNQFLAVQTTSVGSSQSGIDLLRSDEFSATDWRIINDGGTLKFMDEINNFSTSGDENMRISNNGYVGIGETSPQARLHLEGNSFLSGSSGGNFLRIGNSSGSYLAFDNNEIGARTNTNIPTTLFMQYWGGNLNLCNDDSGRVGVGLSSPSAKLHVTGGLDVSLTGGGELVLGNVSTTNIGMDGNEIQARNNGIASALFVQHSGGDVLLVPNANGQVGIGVTTSANMPSNLYLLAVDGKAIFEEVRVEVSGSWPDYVFQDEYKLLPLQELENKIKAQGHLPGIPKASVVEKEGFDLGDMQKRMLEKIEELTLYMIQANKEITALKEDNIKLKSIINSIK